VSTTRGEICLTFGMIRGIMWENSTRFVIVGIILIVKLAIIIAKVGTIRLSCVGLFLGMFTQIQVRAFRY
jgi:hypothetical protein